VPDGDSNYDVSSFDTLGDIEISGGSVVDATSVYISGGKFTVNDSVAATGFFFVAGMAPPPDGGSIDVSASREVNFTGTAPLQIEVDPGSGPVTPTQPDGGPYYSGITAFGGSPIPGDPPSDAPDISISGGDVNMTGFSGVINQRFGPGNAGDIDIKGQTVAITNGAVVGNVNFYAGSGDSVGNITVDANQVILDGEGDPSGFTGLNSSSFFSPVFGLVDIPPPFDPFNPELTYGDSGDITVNATGPGGLTIRGGASIIAESRNFGQAGNISVNASNLFLTTDGMPFGAIASQSAFAGDSGDIQVNASGDIQIQEGFEITGSTAGTGAGGNVSVTAGNSIDISDENSGIASATVEPPPQVEDLLAQQFGAADFNELVAILMDFGLVGPDADLFDAMAALQTMELIDLGDPDPTAGNAGPVAVNASSLAMQGAARITSSTTADGEGGPVTIQTGSLLLSDGAEIRSRSGLVSPATGELDVGSGNGGLLDINVTGTATVTGRAADGSPSSISTSTQGEGNGGNLSLTANIVNLNDGGSISASSSGTGLAGDIVINAVDRFDSSGGRVTTQTTVSDGGNIQITTRERVYLDQADITTSVESGFGGGGNINIDPEFVILNQSNILANAFGGPGGNINIVADNFIISAQSSVDASSALGLDGTVNISSPDAEVAEELAVLPANYLDVTSLMSERCGTTAGASSLVDAGPGGLVVDPDGYLPSFAAQTNQEDQAKGRSRSVSSGKRWWALHAGQPALQFAQVTCTR
jgi:large exoprotein involved in heme utilization and adhesion